MTKRIETVEEYLARGGEITRVPANIPKVENPITVVSSSTGGPAVIMTYGEADLFYGDIKKKRVRKAVVAKKPAIDFSVLPEAVRLKFLKGIEND